MKTLLLTPGPLTTTDTVKGAMMADWCTWDADYNRLVVENVRRRLVALATARTDDYTAVLLQGSGTYAVEATIGSTVRPSDRLHILANGAYGARMKLIARYHSLGYSSLTFDETQQCDPQALDAYLSEHKETTHVSLVHCETTTGILNPLPELCAIVKAHGCTLIVDAMSSFGGIPFDIAELGIDFMVSSANKCVQGVPGFGFVIARREALAECRSVSPSLSLDLYDQWETMERGCGKWRFTSPTHVVRAFQQALDELDAEGGVPARYARYTANHRALVDGMRDCGFTTLLPDAVQSPIITSFLYPSRDFDFPAFYRSLKRRGFIIYPGKISQADTFRIGSIGDVRPEDFGRLADSVRQIMEKGE